MLSWIFWHSRFPDVPGSEYRETLRAFHERLAAGAPGGFMGSRVLSYDSVPWLSSATEVFEDWYFIRDSAALDALDAAIVEVFLQDTHARIARLAATATAGLYRLRTGEALTNPGRMTWLNKPRGESYDSFIGLLSQPGALWCRQMVLGPTPEFCLESDSPVSPSIDPYVAHSLIPRQPAE